MKISFKTFIVVLLRLHKYILLVISHILDNIYIKNILQNSLISHNYLALIFIFRILFIIYYLFNNNIKYYLCLF